MKCLKCNFKNPPDSRFCSSCGTQIHYPEKIPTSYTETIRTYVRELTRGSTLAGRYEVIEELGGGGMGKVYRVLDSEIKEEVAVKILRPEIADDKETIERFRNELIFSRKISHRNVCRMYDLSKAQETYYITMEYVPSEDLKTSIRRPLVDVTEKVGGYRLVWSGASFVTLA